MLTDKYFPIDNCWYIDQLKQLIPDGRVSHHKYSDADSLRFNILMPDSIIDDDGEYGGMISSGNSELGDGRLSQFPSVFTAICMNGNIWDQNRGWSISKVHRGNKIDLNDLRDRIATNVSEQIPLIPGLIAKFLETKTKLLETSVKNIVAEIALTNAMHKTQTLQIVREFAQHESQHKSLFGVVNAITRAGQKFDRETWFTFDLLGGKLTGLNNSQWTALNTRAKNLTQEQLEKAYGVSV